MVCGARVQHFPPQTFIDILCIIDRLRYISTTYDYYVDYELATSRLAD